MCLAISFLLSLFLHHISSFPINLSLLACFGVPHCSSLLSIFLSLFGPLSSSVSSPFPSPLPLQSISPSIPPSLSLKQKSWLPSYLQPPCSDANHDQITVRTYISLAGCHLLCLSPSPTASAGSCICLPASGVDKKRKKQAKCLLYLALSWQISTFNTLSLPKFKQSARLSRMCTCLYTACEDLYRKAKLSFWVTWGQIPKKYFMLPSRVLQNGTKTLWERGFSYL